MILTIIFLLLFVVVMLGFALWWAVVSYRAGYHKGYQDACQWVDEHTGNIPTPSYIVEEP